MDCNLSSKLYYPPYDQLLTHRYKVSHYPKRQLNLVQKIMVVIRNNPSFARCDFRMATEIWSLFVTSCKKAFITSFATSTEVAWSKKRPLIRWFRDTKYWKKYWRNVLKLSYSENKFKNLVYDLARHNSSIAQWLELYSWSAMWTSLRFVADFSWNTSFVSSFEAIPIPNKPSLKQKTIKSHPFPMVARCSLQICNFHS